MTDVPDGSGPIRRTRVNDGGAPVTGALAMVLAVLAVVAGFFILRSITDGGDDGGGLEFSQDASGDATPGVADGETAASTLPLQPTTTTSTVPPIVVEGAQVVVANANGLAGSAGAMSDALQLGPGYETVTPTNASASTPDLEASIIYYDTTVPAAQVVAESLSRSLGGDVAVEPMPENIPTADGTLNGAQVLLMLGTDKANRTLDELNPAAAEPAVTAPATETSAPAADG